MIRKSTLVVLLVAILAGGGAYYYETKHAAPPPPAASKPAFAIQTADVQAITISHPAKTDVPPVQLQKRGDNWEIIQPVDTPADSASAEGIVDGVAQASVTETEPASPDRLKAYGLDPAAVSIDFTLKNGAKHKVLLGNKDFTGDGVYALVDSGSSVSVLPDSLLSSADKSADDLRDHAVLHVQADQVASAELKNGSSDVALKKNGSDWNMTKPGTSPADADTISSILSAVSTAKMAGVASETPGDLAKYGLANPQITLTFTNDIGKSATLVVGQKNGDKYYARDTSRPTIFSIDSDLYKKLDQTSADLLDKTPLHFDESNIGKFEIHDASGTIVAERKAGGDDWVIDSPNSQNGKTAMAWKAFSPVSALKADQVIEKPTAAQLADLSHPAYELILTAKSGKQITFKVSKESGDFVYAKSSEGPALYKLKKQSLSDISITAADLSS